MSYTACLAASEKSTAYGQPSDVRRIALSLPETLESTERFAFSVRNKDKLKGFVWVWLERIAPKKPRIPRPDVIAVRVANLYEKDLLLSMDLDEVLYGARTGRSLSVPRQELMSRTADKLARGLPDLGTCPELA